MTEPITIALIATIPPTLAASGAVLVGFHNIKKSNEIHVLVNSNLTKVKADLDLALARVAKLEELLIKRNEDAKT